jgi:hypothetical protein
MGEEISLSQAAAEEERSVRMTLPPPKRVLAFRGPSELSVAGQSYPLPLPFYSDDALRDRDFPAQLKDDL